MTDTPAITKEERKELSKGYWPSRFLRNTPGPEPDESLAFAAYESRLQQLEEALAWALPLVGFKDFGKYRVDFEQLERYKALLPRTALGET